MATRLVLPRLYVILDAALLNIPEQACAQELADAGVRLMQYRNKATSARALLEVSRGLAERLVPQDVLFFVNDRPDVAELAGASGAHVGQEDLSVEHSRAIVGPKRLIGVSTHNEEQFRQAAATSADYIAVGPIFSTGTKANPDPVVRIEFVRKARRLTEKPIVAIGGITLEWAAALIEAGADAVAVIGDILRAANPAERARKYIEVLARVEPDDRSGRAGGASR